MRTAAIVGAVGLVLVPFCRALAQAPSVEFQPHLSVSATEIRGIVLHSDGETPVVDLVIKVWDADKEKTVFETRTNADGVFVLPRLGKGRFFVRVGKLKIDLEMYLSQQQGQRHDILVVIPRRMLVSFAIPPEVMLIPFIPPPPPPVSP